MRRLPAIALLVLAAACIAILAGVALAHIIEWVA